MNKTITLNEKTLSTKLYIINPKLLTIIPEFQNIFKIDIDNLESLKEKITNNGFRKDKPIICWENNGQSIVVDGHHRRQATLDLKMDAYIIYRKFKNKEEVIMFMYQEQFGRRNSKSIDKFITCATSKYFTKNNYENLTFTNMKRILSIGKTTSYQYATIIKSNDIKLIQLVISGNITLEKAYYQIKKITNINKSHKYIQNSDKNKKILLDNSILKKIENIHECKNENNLLGNIGNDDIISKSKTVEQIINHLNNQLKQNHSTILIKPLIDFIKNIDY